MNYKDITVTTRDFVSTITLNRPPANAINLGIREELNQAIIELEQNKDTRVMIITGAGDWGFSVGMDVTDIANIKKGPNGNDVFNRIDRLTKPVIASINGHALGGGCELALACHFRFMTDNPKATIGCPELNLGITPGWGGIQRLPRLLGRSKALDMILFSKRLLPQEALAIGLVDRVFPRAELMKETMAFALALTKRPPIAVSAVLNGMAVGLAKGIEEGIRVDREWAEKIAKSNDAKEGFTAFLEKREPVFKGE
jgi:enoyl-CoA hydratase/3-hydroxyacyl-CoA dehydrogenase